MKPWNKGIPRTQEVKIKLSKALKNRHNSPKTEFKKGQKHYWQSGETKDKNGYIFVYSPNHPFRNGINYIRRARLVMEKYLGRYLKPEEVTHHINGIRDDDRIKNLMLFANNGEHRKFHKMPRKNGRFI